MGSRYCLLQRVATFLCLQLPWTGENGRARSLPEGNEYTLGWGRWRLSKVQASDPPGLSANLLGQDLLGQMDAVITTDHLAFYDDKTEQGVIRQTPDTWIHYQKERPLHPGSLPLGAQLVSWYGWNSGHYLNLKLRCSGKSPEICLKDG